LPGEGEVHWIDLEVGKKSSNTRFLDEEEGEKRLDLDLGAGDKVEFYLLMKAKGPRGYCRWKLDLEFLVGDEKRYVLISDSVNSFVVAAPLPAGAPEIRIVPPEFEP
jgi:hypothetical protein